MKPFSEINQVAAVQIESIKIKCEQIKPLVMVITLTYNHENYLKDALEGFVNQKTTFPFVVIVHEDASTDGTAQILREYAEKYPEIILPIFEQENQYSKKDGSLGRIVNTASRLTGAKYIALCEGDDYWTDSYKLQKQVDFLNSHPESTFCFHAVNVKSEKGSTADTNVFNHLQEKYYDINEIIAKWSIPTCSVVYRAKFASMCPKNANFQYGDNVLWSTLLSYGKGFCINSKMATYRRQPGSWTAQGSYLSNTKQIKHFEALFQEFPIINKKVRDDVLIFYYSLAFTTGIRELKIKSFSYFIRGFKKYKGRYIKQLFRSIKEYIRKNINVSK